VHHGIVNAPIDDGHAGSADVDDGGSWQRSIAGVRRAGHDQPDETDEPDERDGRRERGPRGDDSGTPDHGAPMVSRAVAPGKALPVWEVAGVGYHGLVVTQPPDVEVAKQRLREQLRIRAQGIAPEDRQRRSNMLVEKLVAHPVWHTARCVAAFVGSRHEPQTSGLLEAAWRSSKRVWLPKVDPERRRALQWVETFDLRDLAPGAFGLLEPQRGDRLQELPDCVEVVAVPGLGFSSSGARLGWGMGYYDVALAHHAATRVGLCFREFCDPKPMIPQAPHDLCMHFVATEVGVIVVGPAP
jgi:5-formyltetrahydrofolate cyclo-ligase